ncbi:MAG: AzlD domain-containing protein [Lachnospiraceae bacterium]|nr:AzlD domain-containing protein [Lachnospiraceae bacterium]
MRTALLVGIMSIGTILLRFLPFLVIRKEPPRLISYLGKVLPPAIIGMLVIYCLKDVNIIARPYGIPELIAVIGVIGMQIWRKNAVISILVGTVLYMLIQAFV